MCTVWVVTRLDSYDEREIAAVCSTEEKARAVMQYYEEYEYGGMASYSISKHTVDEEIPGCITVLQHELDKMNTLKNLLDILKSS